MNSKPWNQEKGNSLGAIRLIVPAWAVSATSAARYGMSALVWIVGWIAHVADIRRRRMLKLARNVCKDCAKTTAYCKAQTKLNHIEGASQFWPKYLQEAVEWWLDLDCPYFVKEKEKD